MRIDARAKTQLFVLSMIIGTRITVCGISDRSGMTSDRTVAHATGQGDDNEYDAHKEHDVPRQLIQLPSIASRHLHGVTLACELVRSAINVGVARMSRIRIHRIQTNSRSGTDYFNALSAYRRSAPTPPASTRSSPKDELCITTAVIDPSATRTSEKACPPRPVWHVPPHRRYFISGPLARRLFSGRGRPVDGLRSLRQSQRIRRNVITPAKTKPPI